MLELYKIYSYVNGISKYTNTREKQQYKLCTTIILLFVSRILLFVSRICVSVLLPLLFKCFISTICYVFELI